MASAWFRLPRLRLRVEIAIIVGTGMTGTGTGDEMGTATGVTGIVASRSNALVLSSVLVPSSVRVNCSGSESEPGAATIIPEPTRATAVGTTATAAETTGMAADTTTAKWKRVIVMG